MAEECFSFPNFAKSFLSFSCSSCSRRNLSLLISSILCFCLLESFPAILCFFPLSSLCDFFISRYFFISFKGSKDCFLSFSFALKINEERSTTDYSGPHVLTNQQLHCKDIPPAETRPRRHNETCSQRNKFKWYTALSRCICNSNFVPRTFSLALGLGKVLRTSLFQEQTVHMIPGLKHKLTL